MPDAFISYSTHDLRFAEHVLRHLEQEGVNVFMAPISLISGERWTPQVLNNLKLSPWVIFLASRVACASPYVQQELGAALISGKKIVPIVWDILPSELPGWIDQFQAINIAGASLAKIQAEVTTIAERIKADKRNGLLILGAIVIGLFALAK